MGDINGADLEPTRESFFFPFNPKSSFLSQNLNLLKPTNITLKRGARYKAYAELRESKLRLKLDLQANYEEPQEFVTPPRKRVTFQGSGGRNGFPSSSSSSMVAKSVPDFSAALRKENRKPVPATFEMTPPGKGSTGSKMSKLKGSKSAGGGVMGRKSCAGIEELKGLGSMVGSAINAQGKGVGRNLRGATQKSVLGCRQYY